LYTTWLLLKQSAVKQERIIKFIVIEYVIDKCKQLLQWGVILGRHENHLGKKKIPHFRSHVFVIRKGFYLKNAVLPTLIHSRNVHEFWVLC